MTLDSLEVHALDIYRPQQHWRGVMVYTLPPPNHKSGWYASYFIRSPTNQGSAKIRFSMRMQRMQQKEAIMYDGLNTYLLLTKSNYILIGKQVGKEGASC